MAEKPQSIQYNSVEYLVDEREWRDALVLSKGQLIAENTSGDVYTAAQLKSLQHNRAVRHITVKKARLIVLFENGIIPEVYSYAKLTMLGNDRSVFSPGDISYGPKNFANYHFVAYFLSTKENQLKRRYQNALSASEIEHYYHRHKLTLFPTVYDYVLSYVDVGADTDVATVLTDYDSYSKHSVELLIRHRKSDEIPWGSALTRLQTMQLGQFGQITNDYFPNRVFRLEQKQLKQTPSLDEAAAYIKKAIATQQLDSEINRVLSTLRVR